MRILMLGNSLTTCNDMPALLAELTDAELRVHARGGGRLAEHLNGAASLGGKTLAALSAEKWDYVILQEMSKAPAVNTAAYLRAVGALCPVIRAAGAVPVLYGTWPYREGCRHLAQTGMSYEEMYAKMHGAFLEAARISGALLADVCEAFYNASARESLYAEDGVHPSPSGSKLAAELLAARILKQETERRNG